VIRKLVTGGATAAALLGLPTAPALAFQTGDVYWAAGACTPATCPTFEVDAGAGAVTPFVAVDDAPGQFAWESDLSAFFVSQFPSGTLLRVTSAGASSTFAWAIPGATGLLVTSGGSLLAVSYSTGVVIDASAGGDLSVAPVFASGFVTPRNLIERPNGDILLVDQTARAVYEISGGGDFSSATPFASGFPIGAYDLVEDDFGDIYLSTRLGIYEISSGGDFSAEAPFASGRFLVGLAIDHAGRLLASEFESGDVYDISGGGDVSNALPVASIANGLGDSALDTVPMGGSEPPQVPLLGPLGYGLLASLLATSGAACGRRSGTRQRRWCQRQEPGCFSMISPMTSLMPRFCLRARRRTPSA
jgi:hypothetical protein